MTGQEHVNLGDLSEACITRPMTCSADGATVALWFKVGQCTTSWQDGNGVLSSSDNVFENPKHDETTKEGFIVSCFDTGMRYTLEDP